MKILIIEDSDYKTRGITGLLATMELNANIMVEKSFQSGMKKLMEEKPELVILDMALPTSDPMKGESESRNRPFGGEELIREIELENINTKVIVLTQFDQFPSITGSIDHNTIFKRMKLDFPCIFFGGVYYNVLNATWEKNLKILINGALKK
jgi:DNA-binding NarL/FixJ family response regulator